MSYDTKSRCFGHISICRVYLYKAASTTNSTKFSKFNRKCFREPGICMEFVISVKCLLALSLSFSI